VLGYEPYQRGNYNPLVARAYYSRYPLLVAQRTAQLLRYSYCFLWNTFMYEWWLDIPNVNWNLFN